VLRIAFVLSAVVCLLTTSLHAQSSRTRASYRGETVYAAQVVNVPLQPFSLNRQSPSVAPGMQVAYYAPRRALRAEPVERDEEETQSTPQFETRGSQPMVPGNRAILRNGVAYAPSNAPDNVKHAIWAVNTIRNRPYVWGGGHGSFHDYGYDCSGTVSFALHYAGALNQPLPSNELVRFGERGRGRWITVYSRRGHTFAMIAGLRLDTTDFRYGADVGPRWHLDGRDTRGFEARHPAKL
jgi:cell wall-associated NlpC family hydrolase